MVLESLEVGGEIELEKENHILVSSSQDGLEMIVEEIRASSEIRHLLDYSTPQYGESLEKRTREK